MFARFCFTALAVLALAAFGSHAFPVSPFEELLIAHEGFPGGLKELHSLVTSTKLKLQSEVDEKEGDKAEIFDLKKAKLTNVLYWSYGEWTSIEDLHNHLNSAWFKDFAEQANSIGAKWEFKWLQQVSERAEDKKRGREEGEDKKELTSVVGLWVVPPAEKKSFVEAWNKAADATAKEEGNKIMSLSKAMSNNYVWYSYGSWDNLESYLSHMESKHHEELKAWATGANAAWVVVPLEKIGNQRE